MSASFADDAGRKFAEYHTGNPDIWRLFERLSLECVTDGSKRYGAMAIFNRIRWEEIYDPLGRSGEPKVQNTWAPFYARLFQAVHPKHAELFVTKPSIADDCMDYIHRLAKTLARGTK